MGDIVNLRRARKAKVREDAESQAAQNRIRHGTPKPLRALTKARSDKAARELEASRLNPEKTPKG